jgi:bifunctional non-homologous end joining protein LigD
VANAAGELNLADTILDGEVVVLGPDGTSNFQSLQNHLQRGHDDDIVYFVFDLPFCQGVDLTACTLSDRKELLRELLAKLPPGGVIRYSDHILGHGSSVLQSACRHGIEGIISKRIDSPYEQRRSRSWVKSKCLQRQEFVIGGWSDPGGSREAFGSLLLGYYDDQSRLVYSGRVGTGFTGDSLEQIKAELDRLPTTECPFHNRPPGRDSHWVRPELVAEVEFTQWTEEGLLRHPTFQGLRKDKAPREVKREVPMNTPTVNGRGASKTKHATEGKSAAPKRRKSTAKKHRSTNLSDNGDSFAGVRLSNPTRVLYPDANITKQDLAEYYVAVGDWILPHLVHRPLSLVRCPQGQQAKCFFQKHVTDSVPAPVRGIEVEEKEGTGIYVAVDDLAGLITLAQLSCLEIHPWGSREDKIDLPDRLIFDLDPGEEVTWTQMISAAKEMRQKLADLELESFLRTTGGKGLHLVVPIARRTSWDEAKEFARAIASAFVRQDPEGFIDTMSKAKRRGKIFIDYLRNDRGSTAIASYSTRARPGATVATPIHWDELTTRLKPERFTIKTVPKRLSNLAADPWKDFFDVQQSITKSMLTTVLSW